MKQSEKSKQIKNKVKGIRNEIGRRNYGRQREMTNAR
jgi:hypothetical protein